MFDNNIDILWRIENRQKKYDLIGVGKQYKSEGNSLFAPSDLIESTGPAYSFTKIKYSFHT